MSRRCKNERRIKSLATLLKANDRRYSETRSADKEALTTAMTASNAALAKGAEALERRLDGLNEFRESLNDQTKEMLTRREYDINKDALTGRIGELEAWRNSESGRNSGYGNFWTWIVAVAMIGIGFGTMIATFWHH